MFLLVIKATLVSFRNTVSSAIDFRALTGIVNQSKLLLASLEAAYLDHLLGLRRKGQPPSFFQMTVKS